MFTNGKAVELAKAHTAQINSLPTNDNPALEPAQCHWLYFIGVCCPDGHIQRQGKHIVDYDEAQARFAWVRRRNPQLNLYSRRISDSLVLEPSSTRGRP